MRAKSQAAMQEFQAPGEGKMDISRRFNYNDKPLSEKITWDPVDSDG